MSQANTKNKIALCITTHDRYRVFQNSLAKWREYTPDTIQCIVVDDASAIPVKEATYRFDKNVGIARAKNKCLELAEGAEHIFLVDDDVFPKREGWWEPYVNSPINHLCYIFPSVAGGGMSSRVIESDDEHNVWSHPRGCFMYVSRKVLDTVGGLDTAYDKWGYEHKDYSNRIHNAGLTPFPYMDIKGSSKYLHSLDESGLVATTVPKRRQQLYLSRNRELYNRSLTSKEYKEYKA